jgi:hypothetical protein
MSRHRGLVIVDTATPVTVAPPGAADGIIRFDMPLDEAEYERFVARWRDAWKTTSHRVMIVENAPETRRRCAHVNAEPVELITGEVVAAVCADCLTKLPPEWLGCDHTTAVDITSFGLPPGSEVICNGCGGIYAPARPGVEP